MVKKKKEKKEKKKNLPVNAAHTWVLGSFPQSGRSPGVGNGNPLQYSCLENSMDRGAWWGTVPWVHKELDTTEHAHIQKMRIK